MFTPIWVIVFYPSGEQCSVVRCVWPSQADNVIYHNTYYGRRCLKVSVKRIK